MKQVSHAERSDSNPPLVITGEGMAWLGVAFLLGAVGWWKSINLVLLLAYLMLAMVVVNGILARGHAKRVRIRREPTPPVFAGEDAPVRVQVANSGTRTATVAVQDRLGGNVLAWLVNRLPPRCSVTCEGRRDYLSRGRFSVPVRVSTAYPLGLMRYEQVEDRPAEVIVLPAPGHADPDLLRKWILQQAGGDGRLRKLLRRVTTDQADVRGVRPYRPGDPIRSIHWRSSARRQELMVREYDAAPTPDLVMIVEPWLPAKPSTTEREAVEGALSLAVTVARSWHGQAGTRVVVAVAGDPESVGAAGASEESLREALTPLASVKGAASLEPLAARLFDRSLARAARIVVSSRAHSPYADSMSTATGRRFIAISPADHLPWYIPPVVIDEEDGEGTKPEERIFALTAAGVQSWGYNTRK